MRKSLQRQDASVSLENSPGCMWGILHHFNNHRWHNVRKRLPQRRHASGKRIAVDGDGGSSKMAPENGERQENSDSEMNNSAVETNASETSSVKKISMKSRIKALISEEVSRRRSRHRRSSSCPVQTQVARTTSSQHLKPVDQNSSAQVTSDNPVAGDGDNAHSSVASLPDTITPKIQEVAATTNCSPSASMHTMNYLRQQDKRAVKDHTLLQDKSIYAVEPSKTASLQESKLFLDALDLLNMRKELFLKVLQDPNSSLAHQLCEKRLSRLKGGLTKSVSFPKPRSSRGMLVREKGANCERETQYFNNGDYISHNGAIDQGQPEPPDYVSSVSPHQLNCQQKNPLVIKRFKNIGEKIKHAIKESRKERRRIIMDAVLHKIPYGKRSREYKGKADTHAKPSEIYSKNSVESSAHCELQGLRRTSSFSESFEKYNRLLESDFSREARGQTSGRLRLRSIDTPSPIKSSPKKLGRIFSLPDISCNYGLQNEESPDASSWDTSASISMDNSRFGEQRPTEPHLNLENHIQLDTISEHESQDELGDVGENVKDLVALKLGTSESTLEHIAEQKKCSSSMIDELILGPAHDLNYQEGAAGHPEYILEADAKLEPRRLSLDGDDRQQDPIRDSPTESGNAAKLEDVVALATQFNDSVSQPQIHQIDSAEFDYVNDVLELSGFSKNEFLGVWHSPGQAVDPSLFVELEGSLLAQPEFAETEDGSCDRLLLFDLINEVLLDTYDKSSSYWLKPLTFGSHIHPMPMGHHVIEEVWSDISRYLRWKPDSDQSLDDDAVAQDLAKYDGWMNLQFDAECVGLELEELLVDDLLDELISDFSLSRIKSL